MKILILEPYYGGSHKTFINGLESNLPFDFIRLTLSARKWKWRMRLAAPFFAEKITSLIKDTQVDIFFCSSFIDVATLRSLLPTRFNLLPFYTYFHENQFAYPVRLQDERDVHFGLTNLTTALASDKVAFNTLYNMQTFLAGAEHILKHCPDMKFDWVRRRIEAKSTILYPGIDFSQIDTAPKTVRKNIKKPVIVWNHRWEHDKNPELFFKTLFKLDAARVDFRLIVLGQSFRRQPAIFDEARRRLKHKIKHFGFVESRETYARLLATGDIVVSTAQHEFYGISVIEAVRAGCRPLLPARLSYPELFPEKFLYEDGELYSRLHALLASADAINRFKAREMTNRFSWPQLRNSYSDWFSI